MRILVGTDIVPVKSNMVFFERSEVEKLVAPELAEVLQSCSLSDF